MDSEKMDTKEDSGYSYDDTAYPMVEECIRSVEPALKPASIPEAHVYRVIDELWKMYNAEHDKEAKLDILRALLNGVTTLQMVREK